MKQPSGGVRSIMPEDRGRWTDNDEAAFQAIVTKLEPEIMRADATYAVEMFRSSGGAMLSIAISLKRIADAFERWAPTQKEQS